MTAEMGELFMMFKNIRTAVDKEELLKVALEEFTFSKSVVDKIEAEYKNKPDKAILDLCKLL